MRAFITLAASRSSRTRPCLPSGCQCNPPHPTLDPNVVRRPLTHPAHHANRSRARERHQTGLHAAIRSKIDTLHTVPTISPSIEQFSASITLFSPTCQEDDAQVRMGVAWSERQKESTRTRTRTTMAVRWLTRCGYDVVASGMACEMALTPTAESLQARTGWR